MGGLLGGGGSKKASKNAAQVAQTQQQYNVEAANLEAGLNRYNENTPYASTNWTKDPATGQWTVNQTATPQLQGAINSSLGAQTATNKAAQGAVGRVASTIGTKFDTSGLPQAGATPTADAQMRFTPQSNVPVTSAPNAGPVQTGLGNNGSAFGALFGAGAVPDAINVQGGQYQSGLPDAGGVQSSVQSAGDIQRSTPSAGGINSGIAPAGNIMSRVADAGQINQNVGLQTGLGDRGQVQQGLDFSGAPSLYGSGDVSSDYNSAVGTAFGAQKTNIDEAYGTQRKQLEQRLADQGIPMDSEAARFQMAQLDKNRDAGYIQAQAAAANTGLNTQSTLSGLSLANRGQMVGETATQGQFGNQGQQQNFNQMLQSGQFGNDAMMAAANYGLNAQGQQYGQNANNTAVNNAAQAQQFGQNQTQAQFGNAAQAQQFGQNQQSAALNNSAQAQQYGQNANDMSMGNAAQAQRYAQGLSSGQFANDATGRQFADQLAASGQNYGQQANTQATRFGQQSGAQSEAFDQSLASGNFYNQGQGQGFNQGITAGQFNNTAQQQQFDQNRARLGDYNSGAQQDFQNSLASSQQQNALRSQEFGISADARAIPINEATSFLGAMQPTPQLPAVQTPAIGVGAPDYAGTYQNERQAQAQKQAGKMGAIGSAGAAVAMCWVAREVYGAHNPAWLEVRAWMLGKAPAWLRSLYLRYGERFARFIADKPRVKVVIRRLMDQVR